jgi:competence protein ComFC
VCCGREKADETSAFCEACKCKIKFISGNVCDKCGAPITGGRVCDVCKKETFHFDKARAAVVYDETSSLMILKFKYSKAKYLENRLVELLLDCFSLYKGFDVDMVTFVPMTQKKIRERGYNQTEELAKVFCEKTGLDMVEALIKEIDTKAQAGLDRAKRKENLKGLFKINDKVRRKVKGKRLLLIDDVFTTGSTADECAKVLKRAGVSAVFVLTIAKTIIN